MKLENKTIVLTGGSSGVGLDLLRALGASNAIINLSRRAPPEDAVQLSPRSTHIATDLADAESVHRAIEAITHSCPDGVDGLINCAAVQFLPKFTDTEFDPSSIATEIAINLTSPAQLIHGLIGHLRMPPESFILNVNSGLGLVPKAESAVYCATKGGLDNLSRGLRAQLNDTNIRVQQAFLPLVDTPMTTGRGSGKLSPQEVARQIIRGIERGTPDNDIGKARLLRVINRLSPSIANAIMQIGDS
ncbi:SDR family NAD(P)-dependent oxidoreductase [Qipengyuania sp. DSG2-2]|uniref:SDR family NAD(P)-dependent oxidoreductase n=1 Tax=Qipengyuania sp. DGS2-2 TaxID=3349631 RepID=UPI0036D25EC7